MSVPGNLLYTDDHEWVLVEGDEVVVGITDFAQSELGDIVMLELVGAGEEFEKGDSIGTIEAVKAMADIYAPVSGEITEVNEALADTPDAINGDPYHGGWLYRIKLRDVKELEDLMGPDEYEKHIEI